MNFVEIMIPEYIYEICISIAGLQFFFPIFILIVIHNRRTISIPQKYYRFSSNRCSKVSIMIKKSHNLVAGGGSCFQFIKNKTFTKHNKLSKACTSYI